MKKNVLLVFLVLVPLCAFAAPPQNIPQQIQDYLHNGPASHKISASQLLKRLGPTEKITLIDVRTPQEFAVMHLTEAINIPYDQLAEHLAEIPRDGLVVAICHSGRRAEGVTTILHLLGYDNVVNLSGGLKALTPAITSKSAPQLRVDLPQASPDFSPDDDDEDDEEDMGC